ncbi:reverse transcriptase domain-containing protein [Tanacetum coccineum]|uniref:Reverse transcriptase domain-containing protein n=1 Tax=Tanacetum coccineum TaxID=301880 RepID=A0ABQ4Y1X1_9ASTR
MAMIAITREVAEEGHSILLEMESVFHISNCTVGNQIKFATCTLLGSALMWYNSYFNSAGHDAAYGMTWKILMKMLTEKYNPRKSDQVEKYVGGLPNMIQVSEMASKPKTMQEAIKIANDLIDQKQNIAMAYSTGLSEKKEYAGTLPLSPAATNNQRTLTCYECGNQGHYRSDCLELKNQNHGNQARGTEARGMVYALGGGETDQDLDNMEDDINA